MKYTVIKQFTDLKDNNYKYVVGSTYPRGGYVASESRIKELSTKQNRQGTPLIKADAEEEVIVPVQVEEKPVLDIEPVEEEAESKPKARRGRKKNVE